MKSAKLNLSLIKGTNFIEEFQFVDEAGVPLAMENKKVVFVARESLTTATKVFDLELTKIDEELCLYKLQIDSCDTVIAQNMLEYKLIVVDTREDFECVDVVVIYGKLFFIEG